MFTIQRKKMIPVLTLSLIVVLLTVFLAESSLGQGRLSASKSVKQNALDAVGTKSRVNPAVAIKQPDQLRLLERDPRTPPGRTGRATWWVPDPSHSIQDVIDNIAVEDGDIIYVGPGTYIENIDFKGKAILIQSTGNSSDTFIEPANSNKPVVYFQTGEGTDSVLDGFTIRNGLDGGIVCDQASPTIRYCSIENNTDFRGAGILGAIGSPVIENNTFLFNFSTGGGGGAIHCYSKNPIIRDNYFQYNTTEAPEGGAIFIGMNCVALIENNQILDNTALGLSSGLGGGGIFCNMHCTITIRNNTITGNSTTDEGGGIHIHNYTAATISGNTISANSAEMGGGIACSCPATITDNTITENTAVDEGGGVYCRDRGQQALPKLLSNTIEYNSAGTDGGGVYCDTSVPEINDNVIGYNSANGDGGGIWISSASAEFEINDNTIRFNTAKGMGGGIHVQGSIGSLMFRNMIIYNEANGAGSCGGAISCVNSSFPRIKRNTIKGNIADTSGGGIYCDLDAYPTVNYCSITGNQAATGGGISCHDGATPVVATNWIYNNQASGNGGGIYCGLDSDPLFTNNTLCSNDADNGGGVCCEGGYPRFFNMIFWQNVALTSGREVYIDGGEPDIAYSDIEGGLIGVVIVSGSIKWGLGMIDEDPRFKSFTWPVMANYHIETDSPCADAGLDTAPGLTPKDIDRDKRILDDGVDMGVDESDYLDDGLGAPNRETYGNKKPMLYKWDSGTTDNLLCWVSGGDMVGMHCFDTLPGGEMITEVGTIFGSLIFEGYAPGNGTPTDFYIWEATSFGDPSNATLLAQGTGVVENVDTDVHHWDACPCTVTTPNFWVAYNLHHAPYEYCLSIDSTNPYVTGAAFFTGTNTLYGFDPSNLYGNMYPPDESSYGFWTVRANY